MFNDKSIHRFDATNFGGDATVQKAKLTQLGEGKGNITVMHLFGGELYVGDDKGRVYVLNAETLEPLEIDGKLVEVVTEYKKEVTCLSVSASMLAIGSKDGLVTVYDLASRTKKIYWKGHQSAIN